MTNPLRKEKPEQEQQLTTDDIARNRASTPEAPMPVRPERSSNVASFPEKRTASTVSEREATSTQRVAAQESAATERKAVGVAATPIGAERSTTETASLFPSNEGQQFHERWNAIQVSFVDEPRKAVKQADELVASTMKRLAEVFSEERTRLEHQWDRGDQVSTEDLRVALQRYRSFFQRLLAI